MDPLVTTLVVLGVIALAGVVVVSAAHRKQTGAATGALARETIQRDRRGRKRLGEMFSHRRHGRAWEMEQVRTRREPPGEIVPVSKAEPEVYVPLDPEAVGVTRRQFFNRSIVGLMTFSLSGFGAAVVGFLWPQSTGGFGSKIRVGSISDIKAQIRDNNGFLYVPEGKMWITEYPASALPKAERVYSEPELVGMRAGLIALYQKCPHLGCRVPECVSSQWFECPCHGSRYNQVGEKKGGPAPRGMDRFAMEVNGDTFVVDTGTIIQGPPIGTDTTGQEPAGPSCLGAATGGHA
ncbi:MAG: hypothetical protein KatS3mg008_1177 [Acidimicrobiales bacterium]|nr:MAG: hypothetical protein KatS3mg008_1177 [Acidimicrobiales bacterium]